MEHDLCSEDRLMTEKYVIHYWFEWGGQCLWGGDERTKAKYGYAIDTDKLPLSDQTKKLMYEVGKFHDTSLNWNDPMAPSPWGKEDEAKFLKSRLELLEILRREIGDQFEILDGQEISNSWKPDE